MLLVLMVKDDSVFAYSFWRHHGEIVSEVIRCDVRACIAQAAIRACDGHLRSTHALGQAKYQARRNA